jgi:hypothetical protein
LQYWAELLGAEWRAGRDVFAYFHNDPEGMAVINARALRSLMIARLEDDKPE